MSLARINVQNPEALASAAATMLGQYSEDLKFATSLFSTDDSLQQEIKKGLKLIETLDKDLAEKLENARSKYKEAVQDRELDEAARERASRLNYAAVITLSHQVFTTLQSMRAVLYAKLLKALTKDQELPTMTGENYESLLRLLKSGSSPEAFIESEVDSLIKAEVKDMVDANGRPKEILIIDNADVQKEESQFNRLVEELESLGIPKSTYEAKLGETLASYRQAIENYKINVNNLGAVADNLKKQFLASKKLKDFVEDETGAEYEREEAEKKAAALVADKAKPKNLLINEVIMSAFVHAMQEYQEENPGKDSVKEKFAFLIKNNLVIFNLDDTLSVNGPLFDAFVRKYSPKEVVGFVNEAFNNIISITSAKNTASNMLKGKFALSSTAASFLKQSLEGAFKELADSGIDVTAFSVKDNSSYFGIQDKYELICNSTDPLLSQVPKSEKAIEAIPEIATATARLAIHKYIDKTQLLTDKVQAVFQQGFKEPLVVEKEKISLLKITAQAHANVAAENLSMENGLLQKDIKDKKAHIMKEFLKVFEALVCQEDNKKFWKKMKWSFFPGAPKGISKIQDLFGKQKGKLADNVMIAKIFEHIASRPEGLLFGRRQDATRELYKMILDDKTGIPLKIDADEIVDFPRLKSLTKELENFASRHKLVITQESVAPVQSREPRKSTYNK